MSELAEGARLEIVCAATSGTEGSNPSLSAIYFFAPEHSPGGQVLLHAAVKESQHRPGETSGSTICYTDVCQTAFGFRPRKTVSCRTLF